MSQALGTSSRLALKKTLPKSAFLLPFTNLFLVTTCSALVLNHSWKRQSSLLMFPSLCLSFLYLDSTTSSLQYLSQHLSLSLPLSVTPLIQHPCTIFSASMLPPHSALFLSLSLSALISPFSLPFLYSVHFKLFLLLCSTPV